MTLDEKTKIIQDYIKLLDEVDELKSKLFESNTIDSLRSMNFEFNKNEKNLNLNETKPKLASKGD